LPIANIPVTELKFDLVVVVFLKEKKIETRLETVVIKARVCSNRRKRFTLNFLEEKKRRRRRRKGKRRTHTRAVQPERGGNTHFLSFFFCYFLPSAKDIKFCLVFLKKREDERYFSFVLLPVRESTPYPAGKIPFVFFLLFLHFFWIVKKNETFENVAGTRHLKFQFFFFG
jgi:hypothetical protein